MAAVAQRCSTTTERPSASHRVRKVRRTRVRRSPRIGFWLTSRAVICVIAGLSLFGWMSVYAKLTVTGYSRSRLLQMCRQEQLKHERLEVKWNSLSSPHNVVAAAEKSGMVYATDYDYIRSPQTIASVSRSDE
ncbi:MAG: hypothetical protein M1133_00205 [Armatimonadetes bacterium]|nr:hypothetical protein [Armatimonadota bacterium]